MTLRERAPRRRLRRRPTRLWMLALAGVAALPAAGQPTPNQPPFVSGQAAALWEKWKTAMQAVAARDREVMEFAFGELLADDPSPLRIALFADYTLKRLPNLAGSVLLLEQDYQAGALGDNGRKIAERMLTGREQMNEADDGWYFASIGRFDIANANFRALLKQKPDPIALVELTDQNPRRRQILLQIADHPIVGEAAREMLHLLEQGERALRADPIRIKQYIRRLAGPPRGYANALERLKAAGEYAIPFMIQTLRDPQQRDLVRPILRALPQIDRPALNPLVMALRVPDQTVQQYVIEALGKIGYWQAIPYLLQLKADAATPPEIRAAVDQALVRLRPAAGPLAGIDDPAEAFYVLADQYYAGNRLLAADPRYDTANVWYWRDDILQNIEVPTPIFDEIMAMRCCEECLRLQPDHPRALALWVAANLRREAQLPAGQKDYTRPEPYPPGIYFAQSAGPRYCQLALARAIDDHDPAVALGTIEALRRTAGPASILTPRGGRVALAEALSFPNRMVRVRAALALGRARPRSDFAGSQNLMPVLNEALRLYTGARNALVVDPDDENANRLAAALRAEGYAVLTGANLFETLHAARERFAGVDAIVVASDITGPDLAEGYGHLRSEAAFAAVPVVVLTKPGTREIVERLVAGDPRVTAVPASVSETDLPRALAAVARAVGVQPIDPAVGKQLTLEALGVLEMLGATQNPLFGPGGAEKALLDVLASGDAELMRPAARVLAYVPTRQAQEAIAALALDDKQDKDLRIAMFDALAQAGRLRGNHLSDPTVAKLVDFAEHASDLTLREAASRAVGALNLGAAPASTIIRDQYSG